MRSTSRRRSSRGIEEDRRSRCGRSARPRGGRRHRRRRRGRPHPHAQPDGHGFGVPGDRSTRGGGRHGGGFRDGAQVTELASKLGVSEDKVREALQAIREENRSTTPPADQTREQRDAALAKALAEKLNLDEAKVTQALAEIRAAKQAERAAALKERLDAAVADGTLTQAEADAVTKAVEQGVISGGGRGPR